MKLLEKTFELVSITEEEKEQLRYRKPMIVDEIMVFEEKTRIGSLPI